MENKRKIIGYKQPFDMINGELKKGDKWIKSIIKEFIYINKDGYGLPAEIVEQWEPIYEEIKLEDLPKVSIDILISLFHESEPNNKSIRTYFKVRHPNGVIILPE